jgi:hypothetical protein
MSTKRRNLAIAVLALTLGAAFPAAPAVAAARGPVAPSIHPTGSAPVRDRKHSWASVIVSPRPGADLHGRSVHVIVSRRSAARSLTIRLGGRGVKAEFHARGRREVATLSIGRTRGLRFGRNTIRIRSSDGRGRRAYASTSFFLLRRSPTLLRKVSARAVAGGARVGVALGRPGISLGITVNGRRALRYVRARNAFLSLDADDGIRPGVNRIKVEATDRAGGIFAVRDVRLVRAKDRPVAGAGPARKVGVRRAARLDAAASIGPYGDRLRYRWRIVSAPRRSRARLTHADRARPLLRPDRPGHYLLEVRVAKAPAGRAGASRVASASSIAAETGGEPFQAESTDLTTVTATIAAQPIGAAIDTIMEVEGKLGVQLATIAAGGGFTPVSDAEDALQLVAYDRETLERKQSLSFENSPSGAAGLLAAVKELTSADLVVISKPDPTITSGESSAAAATIDEALAEIGAEPVPTAISTGADTCGGSGQCSTFSAIGVPGIPIGQGDVDPGLASPPGSGIRNGDLHGDLQESLHDEEFVFVNRERVPFDTGESGTDLAKVTVGGTVYESAPLPGGGFFVVVLDAGSLQELQPAATYSLATPPPGPGVGDLAEMHAELHRWAGDPAALVIVRSIGTVVRQSGAWDSVAADLQELGGSRFYFDALHASDGSTYFAQVGPGGNGDAGLSPWTQIATKDRNGTGRLSGMLARNPSSQLYPAESAPPGTPVQGTLPGLLSLPPKPWPLREEPTTRTALECVAAKLKISYPIEHNYYTNDNIEWSAEKSTLENATLTSIRGADPKFGCESISEAVFETVRHQLEEEWADLPVVENLIKNLKSPFNGPAGQNADLGSVASAVDEDVEPDADTFEYQALALLSDISWIASAVAPEGEAALNLVSGGLSLVSELDTNPDGSNALSSVTIAADEFGPTLQNEYLQAVLGLEQEQAVILSNWEMLKIAAENAGPDAESAIADWAWGPTDAKKADWGLAESSRRLDFETLFPTRYALYRAQQGTGRLDPEDVETYTCLYPPRNPPTFEVPHLEKVQPFLHTPRYGGVAPRVSGSGQVEQWVYAGTNGAFLSESASHPTFPSETTLQQMFVEPQTVYGSNEPLFRPLQFALEAYANGNDATTITHVALKQPSTTESCKVE